MKNFILSSFVLSSIFSSYGAIVVENVNHTLTPSNVYNVTVAGCNIQTSLWGSFQIDRFNQPANPLGLLDPNGNPNVPGPALKALNVGDPIGATGDYLSEDANSAFHEGVPGETFYLGFKAFNGANTHYGWLKITYSADFAPFQGSVIIEQIAVNDVPNEPINAGQTVLGIDDVIEATSLTLFPNPVSELITIQYDGKSEVQKIDIVSATGQSVKQPFITLSETDHVIDVSDFKKGVYFLTVTFENEASVKLNFVKNE